MDGNIERRVIDFEQRAAGTEDNPIIEGYAAVFGRETVIGNWFREQIVPGAFKRVLSEEPDVVAALNHNWDTVLGRTSAGTLTLEETAEGLRYVAKIDPRDTGAMDIYRRVQRRTITQASFSFTVRADEWTNPPKNSTELPLRNIIEVDLLYDVGPCTFGAYSETSAEARSRAQQIVVEQQEAQPAAGQESPADDLQEQIESRRLAFLKVKIPTKLKLRGQNEYS
jgi:hypothetical protein